MKPSYTPHRSPLSHQLDFFGLLRPLHPQPAHIDSRLRKGIPFLIFSTRCVPGLRSGLICRFGYWATADIAPALRRVSQPRQSSRPHHPSDLFLTPSRISHYPATLLESGSVQPGLSFTFPPSQWSSQVPSPPVTGLLSQDDVAQVGRTRLANGHRSI